MRLTTDGQTHLVKRTLKEIIATYVHATGAKSIESGVGAGLVAGAVGIFGVGGAGTRLEPIDQSSVQHFRLVNLILQLTTQFTH